MRTALTITTAVLALALATPVYAETPQDVPGSAAEGSANANSSAPDTGAADVPGSSAEGNQSPDQNKGALPDESSTNVPGANADVDSSVENQGALSAPEKDKM